MPRLPVNGVNLNVEQAGAGPPLVLLHGFTGSAAGWAEHAAVFAQSHATVAVDLLGHGLSDAPDDPVRYGIGYATEDVLSVLDALGIQRAGLLGYSMGGRVAISLAVVAPERLSALILESASPGIRDAGARRERAVQDAELAAAIEQDGVEPFVDRWERLPLFASQAALPDEARRDLRTRRLQNNPTGLANSLRGLGQGVQPPAHEYLQQIRVPTLLIAGGLDPAYCEMGQEMRALIPQAKLEVVPGAGHAVHLEQPERFRALVLEFLNQGRELG
jgi:2-succinyl-6-hydroxy-2,4-cyclohexadiene-1-carboxylate synthase